MEPRDGLLREPQHKLKPSARPKHNTFMEFIRAYQKYKSFGGIRLLKEYYHLGIIGALVRKAVECLVHRRSLKNVYAVVSEKAAERLKETYGPLIERPTPEIVNPSSIIEHRTVVWFCWLQGMEAAPEMVRVCYESVCRYLPDREVVLIDEENFGDYVKLPEFIMEKRKKGFIPAALFSDILRLELLIRYGGIWIDSTVLMTDPETLMKREWLDEILEANLFMFQYRDREKRFAGIGNWFIVARAGHWALKAVRDVLYAYWRDYDCVVNYYIFHHVFGWIAERHPEVVAAMPKRWAVPSLYLRDRLAMDFDAAFWQELTSHVCLHKLNYRKEIEAKATGRSYWNEILSNNKITI